MIATPTAGHAPLLRLAAEAGVPAFCEKPVALDLATLDDVIARVEPAGILVQVGFQRRFDAGYRAAREAVERARSVTCSSSARRRTIRSARRGVHRHLGGIFRDLHIHDFDAVRYVTGEEIVEVYADGAVRETPWFAEHGDVDAAVAVLRLAAARSGSSRARATIRSATTSGSSSSGRGTASPSASTRARRSARSSPARRSLRSPATATSWTASSPPTAPSSPPSSTTVLAGGESPCDLAEARAALLVALAADRSRAERRPVAIARPAGTETPRELENRANSSRPRRKERDI